MNKIIVTTTINSPSKALIKYSQLKDWKLLVVADKKTPTDTYKDLNCYFMSVEEQADKYPKLSEYIGWNKTERRNLGYVKAYELGADIIATVDDDNIPYSTWGQNVVLDEEIETNVYENINGVFDPLSVTNKNYFWHRGYPLQLINSRHENKFLGKQLQNFLIQADLWDGEPDIDAIFRLTNKYNNDTNFNITEKYSSVNISPFNSQNCFIHRKAIKHYMMITEVGRIQDIWAAYWVQKKINAKVVYGPSSVYQKRNNHCLIKDYEDEYLTYHKSLDFIENKIDDKLKFHINLGYDIYGESF